MLGKGFAKHKIYKKNTPQCYTKFTHSYFISLREEIHQACYEKNYIYFLEIDISLSNPKVFGEIVCCRPMTEPNGKTLLERHMALIS